MTDKTEAELMTGSDDAEQAVTSFIVFEDLDDTWVPPGVLPILPDVGPDDGRKEKTVKVRMTARRHRAMTERAEVAGLSVPAYLVSCEAAMSMPRSDDLEALLGRILALASDLHHRPEGRPLSRRKTVALAQKLDVTMQAVIDHVRLSDAGA